MTEQEIEPELGPMDIPPRPVGLGAQGWLRWTWRSLVSMRTALILLLILILAAIPGSLFPQRIADPLAVNEYLNNNQTIGPILDRLGMFDVFGSAWFAAIYLLLFISLVGCVVPRIGQLWRQWRDGPSEPPTRLGNRKNAITVATDQLPAALADHLKAQRWRVRSGPGWVSAEKGFLREVGNLGFHLSMIALLIAVAAGALFGWRGNVLIREGSGFANTLTQYDAWGGGSLVDSSVLPPFALTIDDFRVDFERGEAQRGAPRSFEADVSFEPTPGAAVESRVLRVNEPIRTDGADIYLIGHGYAPHIIVTSPEGTVLFDDSVVFLPQDGNFTSTGVIKIPDATPQLSFSGIFAPTAIVDDEGGPQSIFPAPDAPGLFLSAFTGDLGLDSGEPQSVYRLDTENLEQIGLEGLAPGQIWTLDDGTAVEFVEVNRWVSLQMSHDPGRMWALLTAGLVMFGLMASLFIPRRRIWARFTDGEVTLVRLARTENAEADGDLASLTELMTSAATASVDNDPTGSNRRGSQ